jgi:DNA polymerase III alpha subunit
MKCRNWVFREQAIPEDSAHITSIESLCADRIHDRDDVSRFASRFASPPTELQASRREAADLRSLAEARLKLFVEAVQSHVPSRISSERIEGYRSRLAEELESIESAGAEGIVMSAHWVRETLSNAKVEAYARGSANNSLVCYLLGLTQVNPFYENLPFQRFCHAERATPPDIDFDLPSSQAEIRTTVIASRSDTAGLMTVCPATFLEGLRRALSIADVSRAEELARHLRESWPNVASRPTQAVLLEYPDLLQKLAELRPGEGHKMELAVDVLTFYDGRPLRTIPHVGVAFFDGPAAKRLPCLPAPDQSGTIQAAVPYDVAATASICKIDLIPNTHLDLLRAVEGALDLCGQPEIPHGSVALNPAHFEAIFDHARLAAIPQLGKHARLAAAMRPRSIHDIASLLALVRLPREAQDSFLSKQALPVDGEAGEIIRRLTRHTRGTVLFEEQMMSALVDLTGMGYADADRLRKHPAEHREQVRLAVSKNHPEADKIADLLCGANKLFNQGHAYAYANLIARTAYAKAEHPAEFFAAFVGECRGEERFKATLSALAYEIRTMGVRLEPPNDRTPRTIPAGRPRNSLTPSRITHPAVQLGLDIFPAVPDTDIERLEKGLTPVAEDTSRVLGILQNTQEFFREVGFVPDSLHPGFSARSSTGLRLRLPGSLEVVDAAANPVSVFGFLVDVERPRPSAKNHYVKVRFASMLGDPPTVATRFFRDPSDATGFFNAMAAAKGHPSVLHLACNHHRGRYYWNVESISPAACTMPCEQFVEAARRRLTQGRG